MFSKVPLYMDSKTGIIYWGGGGDTIVWVLLDEANDQLWYNGKLINPVHGHDKKLRKQYTVSNMVSDSFIAQHMKSFL
jgi:hypothetical protein